MGKRLVVLLHLCLLIVCLLLPTQTILAQCNTVKGQGIVYPPGHAFEGSSLQLGEDYWGYNFGRGVFSHNMANAFLGSEKCAPYNDDLWIISIDTLLSFHPELELKWWWQYRDTALTMRWNDAYLSGSDCDGDHLLDRHPGFSSYRGSGAELSGKFVGSYNGGKRRWTMTYKIVAVPQDAYLSDGVWYQADGTEIGRQMFEDELALAALQLSGIDFMPFLPIGPQY